jgi:hypothetical protein
MGRSCADAVKAEMRRMLRAVGFGANLAFLVVLFSLALLLDFFAGVVLPFVVCVDFEVERFSVVVDLDFVLCFVFRAAVWAAPQKGIAAARTIPHNAID